MDPESPVVGCVMVAIWSSVQIWPSGGKAEKSWIQDLTRYSGRYETGKKLDYGSEQEEIRKILTGVQ